MIGATLLFRQIHPHFVQDGFASSVAFRPNDSDNGLMSVYDGDQITADSSWSHYTTISKKQSAGVTAITVDECTAESLIARPDPEAFLEHAVIDFTGVVERSWRSKSKKLQANAKSRGWLYRSRDDK
jgi:hypothetical protein